MPDRVEPDWVTHRMTGIDRPRPLPSALSARLEEALSAAAEAGPLALGDRLTARLEGALGDPLAPLMEDIGTPRPLAPHTRHRLEQALRSPRRQPRRMWAGVAAGLLVVAGGVAVALGTVGGHGTRSSRALGVATSGTPLGSSATRTGGAPGTGASASSPAGPGAASSSGAAGASQLAVPSALAPVPVVSGLDPDQGPSSGGTWVTVSGSGFSGTTAVAFGASPAIFEVVSAGELRARAPARAPGAVDVRVTTSVGTSAVTTSDRFSYH